MSEAHREQEAELRQRIGQNVRRLRKDRRITQVTAARLGNMHRRHWQKVEAGKVRLTLRSLVTLSIALEVDATELLEKRDA